MNRDIIIRDTYDMCIKTKDNEEYHIIGYLKPQNNIVGYLYPLSDEVMMQIPHSDDLEFEIDGFFTIKRNGKILLMFNRHNVASCRTYVCSERFGANEW